MSLAFRMLRGAVFGGRPRLCDAEEAHAANCLRRSAEEREGAAAEVPHRLSSWIERL